MAATEILKFPQGKYAYVVKIYEKLGVDDVYVSLTKAAAFFIRVGEKNKTKPVPRDIKDALIRPDVVI